MTEKERQYEFDRILDNFTKDNLDVFLIEDKKQLNKMPKTQKSILEKKIAKLENKLVIAEGKAVHYEEQSNERLDSYNRISKEHDEYISNLATEMHNNRVKVTDLENEVYELKESHVSLAVNLTRKRFLGFVYYRIKIN